MLIGSEITLEIWENNAIIVARQSEEPQDPKSQQLANDMWRHCLENLVYCA